ncbi:MAG TPA: DUF1800 family protein, partial [Rubrivivax sp.]|nr:DUF1800 family protein [Rubrivivax sp.]
AIHSTSTALGRLNFVNYLLDGGGSEPNGNVPNAVGTGVDLTAFEADADNPAQLVDRLSLLALGEPLGPALRSQVMAAASAYDESNNGTDYRNSRVRTVAYLIFASPQYQVPR